MSTEAIVRYVHRHYPEVNIVVRAEGVEQMKSLYKDGVYMVILPELEAGLEIARQALLNLKIPIPTIQRFTDSVRLEHYHSDMHSQQGNQDIRLMKNVRELLELSWEQLGEESLLVGKSLRELEIRQTTGVSIVGVLRAGTFTSNPSADFVFRVDDLIAVIGTPSQQKSLQKFN